MKQSIVFIILLGIGLLFSCQQKQDPYEPTWESLDRHKVPTWFSDAKFG